MKLVKVCGMLDGNNISEIEKTGIDWMGFIFWQKSPRFVYTKPSFLPEKCKRIGVFVNPTIEEIEKADEMINLDGIQFHGNENAEFCNKVKNIFKNKKRNLIIIKSFNIDKEDLPDYCDYEDISDYFIFDTKTSLPGGSGICFDWNVLNKYNGNTPFIISGGISIDSIDKIKKFQHQKWIGIDLNSKFELKPGLKDTCKINKFIQILKKKQI